MVRMKNNDRSGIRTTYYLKPGQTLQNTKVSERSLALIVPQSEFERFTSYATESQRVALLAEREAKRLAALKEATYEMSKTWEDTTQNIQRRRKDELLSRKKIEEAERIKFTKEMAAKNALERAEVIKQARELLLYRKPQCRLINRALVVAECLRELEAQIKFKRSLKEIEKKLEADYAQWVLEDVKKFNEEEKAKSQSRLNKLRAYKEELKKQIEKNKSDLRKLEESMKKSEMEDNLNMAKEIDEIKQNEYREAQKKKEELNKMFLETIEEKRKYEEKVKELEEFQDRALKIYKELKQQMEKMTKDKIKAVREEKARKIEALAAKIGSKVESKRSAAAKREAQKKDKADREIEERCKAEEIARIQERQRKREEAKRNVQEMMRHYHEEQEKKKREEMEMHLWEVMQKYKKDEFNKQLNLQHRMEDKKAKEGYAKILKTQMAEKEAQRKQEFEEADDSAEVKEILSKANQRVLTYGEQVLKESEGVRPVFPIVKALQQFKKEVGLTPPRPKNSEAPVPPRRRRGKRIACTKTVSEDNIFYFA